MERKLRRAVVAITIALALSFSAVSLTQNHMPPEGRADEWDRCAGPRFGQLMNLGSAAVLCPIFGPYACAGYGAIVLAYDAFVYWQSGGC